MLDRIRIFFDRVQQKLADFGAALVSPIERLFGRVTGSVLAASEHVERVESVFARLLSLVFWPFRMLGRLLQLLLPEPVYRFFASLAENIQGLFARLGVGVLRLAEALNLDRVVFALVWLLQPIWRPLAAIGIFMVCWLNTRPYRGALMALPAILLATMVLGVGTWHAVFGKGKILANYKSALRETQESKDFELRELLDQKLAQLGEDTQLTQYRTAVALAEDGQLDLAYEQMQLLAPEEREGYPNAHFWMVQQLMGGQLVDSPAEMKRLVRVHLKHLETLEISAPQLTFIEAMLLKQDEKLVEAADLLAPITTQIPGAAFERMLINRTLNRTGEAEQDARTVVTHMKSYARRNTKLTANDYKQWLAAEEILGNVPQMRTLLEEWYELEPDSELVASLLAKVCRDQARSLLRAPVPDQKQIVELWLKAAKLDKRPDALLNLARALYAERASTPVYSQLLDAIHQSPNAPAGLLVAVGTEIAQDGQYKQSRPFFAAAVARAEDNSVAWNNYGLVLSEGDEPNLEQALAAVNKALDLQPKEFRFRESRGQILVKLQRWQEAIDDLEFALNGLPELAQIHESLAVAYAALGQNELAELHRAQTE